ncbi:hypothetical protein DVH05_002577 [Phytophthora capsici]|nr:hypothetical protein DVH05_002577 [Phytophthora capsici]
MDPTDKISDLFNDIPDMTIHVLVNIPEHYRVVQMSLVSVQNAIDERVREALERERAYRRETMRQDIAEMMSELRHKAPEYSIWEVGATQLGATEFKRLRNDHLMLDISPVENGEAFWSEEVQSQADAITKEADFDALIAPYLNDVLGRCGMVFINSTDQWLSRFSKTEGTIHLQPDGFATHPGMYHAKAGPKDGLKRGNGFRFGVAEKELYDCLILFERELTMDMKAFGKVIRYLGNLSPSASACGILFDRRSFWLIKSYKGVIVKVEMSTWVTKGSKEAFQNFITRNTSPWVMRLTMACSSLGVDVVEPDAFLGRGASGCVFKVTRSGKDVLALKIVGEDMHIEDLTGEEMALSYAQYTGLTVRPVGKVFEIEVPMPYSTPTGEQYGTVIGAALLSTPVGTPLPRPTTHEEVQRLFELLWQLHTKGLVHGDPHVSNVIVSDGKLLWIDLVEPKKASAALKTTDAKSITRSILHLRYKATLDPVLEQLVCNYGNNSTLINATELAKEVHHAYVQQKRSERMKPGHFARQLYFSRIYD